MREIERLADALQPHYHVEGEGGRAFGGTVLRALTGEGTPCRIIVLSPALASGLRYTDRFTEALERAGRVAHPGLVPTLGGGVLRSGEAFYSRESLDAEPARSRLAREGAFSAGEVARMGADAADALAAAHAAGVIHGAITPETLLLDAGGARLSELGLHAALAGAGLDAAAIAAVLDLAHYASPEALAGRPDARSDVYSLGAVLYELLIGRAPFGGRTTAAVMASVLTEDPAQHSGGDPRTQRLVVEAILRAIEQRPEDRWPSAAAFADALRGTSERAGQPGRSRGRPRAKRRRGCLPLLLLGAGALAALLAAATAGGTGSGSTPGALGSWVGYR